MTDRIRALLAHPIAVAVASRDASRNARDEFRVTFRRSYRVIVEENRVRKN